jgi:hypothetical protein
VHLQTARRANTSGIFARLMSTPTGSGRLRASTLAACAALAVGLAACGGGERQDEDEPRGDFRLDVVSADFPTDQAIAERSTLRIAVRNADSKDVPNVAVTIKTQPAKPGGAPVAFAQASEDPGLADPNRPVWILDRGPVGGDTAYTNTWALGRLKPGETKRFEWRVTAVQAGRYTVDYEVAPGLDGKARLANGSNGGKGSFRVSIDDTPPDARVDDDGNVIRGTGSGEDGS